MNKSRRDFIKFGALATAFAGTGLFTPVSSSAQNKLPAEDLTSSKPLEDVLSSKTAADFRQYIGAEFMLLQSKGASSVILSEVTESVKAFKLGERPGESKKNKSGAKNFVLSFQFPNGKFAQETYQLWHPDLGQFDLFLVPGKHAAPFLMHAVINRL